MSRKCFYRFQLRAGSSRRDISTPTKFGGEAKPKSTTLPSDGTRDYNLWRKDFSNKAMHGLLGLVTQLTIQHSYQI